MTAGGVEIPERPADDSRPRDGILEDDNPTPAWFTWSWVATWIIAFGYGLYYLSLSGWSSTAQYEAEVASSRAAMAEIQRAIPDANPHVGDPVAIAEGATVFVAICGACHRPDGTGLVGPSLVDPYWKYGSDDATRFETVFYGREGGMPAWGMQLGREKIWKALAYLDTLPTSPDPGFGAPDFVPPTPTSLPAP